MPQHATTLAGGTVGTAHCYHAAHAAMHKRFQLRAMMQATRQQQACPAPHSKQRMSRQALKQQHQASAGARPTQHDQQHMHYWHMWVVLPTAAVPAHYIQGRWWALSMSATQVGSRACFNSSNSQCCNPRGAAAGYVYVGGSTRAPQPDTDCCQQQLQAVQLHCCRVAAHC